MIHIPVLQKEVLEYLDPKPNENFIDCTIGQGGHAISMLERNKPRGKLLGIETDPELCQNLKSKIEEFPNRLILINSSYTKLKDIVKEYGFEPVHGILFDLGMSSWHLEESGRGYSFLRDELLDMRYNPKVQEIAAEDIINSWPESEIENILKEYGEERFSKRIAKEIANSRKIQPIKTTSQLVEIVKKSVPGWCRRQKIHFATRTFQALRIAVNDELNNFKKTLPQAMEVLGPGGRLIIISFHSLEDRIIKNFLRENNKKGLLKILTKKPIRPTKEEIKINPRSRSAKLRAAIK